MDELLAPLVVPVIESLMKPIHESLLEYVLLNLQYEKRSFVVKSLEMGDELCRGRMTPLSPELIKIVKSLYGKCKSSMGGAKGDTPLMLALDMGLMDMVWGFIECAKQTNTNLHTDETGDENVQAFFWISNKRNRTAFDIAFKKNLMEVARLLLTNASPDCLTLLLKKRGETLLRLLNDPKYDAFIFNWLETRQQSMFHVEPERKISIDGLYNLYKGLHGQDANNTVLHLASKIGNKACIQYIYDRDSAQIHSLNSYMETPAYVAAREGRTDILEFMIDKLKVNNENIESILTRSIDQHNALHIATQNHHVIVIFLLIKEVPQLAHSINKVGESPLYLAAERGYFGVVELMLNRCENVAVEGPNGKTALHAAAISDSAECLKYLLNKRRDLLDVQDSRGWTPFQHAVYHNNSLAAKKLLDVDETIGYKLVSEGGEFTSAIHIAASRGHCETMKLLLETCPGCSEFIDYKRRNILHVAVENKKNKAIEFIFQHESLTNLINQKDKNGNTPIHLLAASDFNKLEMLMDSRVNINVLNIEKLTPLDMLSSDDQRERMIKALSTRTSIQGKTSTSSPEINKRAMTKIERNPIAIKMDRYFLTTERLSVVTALIATASFAAAFTVPGGLDNSYGSKQGTPILLRKAAFQVFVYSNAIAFSLSCTVLLGYVTLLLYRYNVDEASLDELEFTESKIEVMYSATTYALLALAITFISGTMVVLSPLRGVAISVCILSVLLIAISLQRERVGRIPKITQVLLKPIRHLIFCKRHAHPL